jgi:hypothetical protein
MKRVFLILVLALALLGVHPREARADATAFWGFASNPHNRSAQGISVGIGIILLGFEFEYASATQDTAKASPGLNTYTFNGLLMTPNSGMQFYVEGGGGLYREELLDYRKTSFATNIGGGVKLGLAGPLRLRLDYRVFSLTGNPLYPTVRRFYAGINARF